MERAIVRIRKGEGRTIKSGGLWVYDNEIDTIKGSYENGDLVSVEDFDGYFLGTGFINNNSKIRIRLMSRVKGQKIDHNFIRNRVLAAIDYRTKIVDMSSCRLIFGEADFLPGLVIDKYSDILVVQSLALGIDKFKEEILSILKEELEKLGFAIRGIYERSDAKVRTQEGLERIKGFIGNEFDTKIEIEENTVKYNVDIADGQKTGFFLDQKYNRKAIWNICKGGKVLDCFTHTGSFALNAAKAGAKSVLGVDASMLAVEQARENAALNQLENVATFECEDVFELLPKLHDEGEVFDVVILDPPAFTKSRNSVKNAMKGYREINLRALKLIRDGGYLVTCSCSHFMTPDLFTTVIGQAAKDTRKRLRQIEYRTQSPDHPILWSADESSYLKLYIFQVIDEK